MTPLNEARDLLLRTRRLLDSVLLLIITTALLLVSVGGLFCTCWITTATMLKNTVDRATARVTVGKGATFDVL